MMLTKEQVFAIEYQAPLTVGAFSPFGAEDYSAPLKLNYKGGFIIKNIILFD